MKLHCLALALGTSLSVGTLLSQDLLFPNSDFEDGTLKNWKTEGEAFKSQPTKGDNIQVRGGGSSRHQGDFWIGTYEKFNGTDGKAGETQGDAPIGTLTSTEFTLKKRYITFLVGAGTEEQGVGVKLVADGKEHHLASGVAFEEMQRIAFDAEAFIGKKVKLVVSDQGSGGFGHINVDDFCQTDDKGELPGPFRALKRELVVSKDFLNLPLINRDYQRGPLAQKFSVIQDGKVLRYLHVTLATENQKPDFTYSMSLKEFKGQTVELHFMGNEPGMLDRLVPADEPVIVDNYDTPERPRFHFSPRIGWMNDINGPYYLDGKYHMFYQYNPAGSFLAWGYDMHWGHAVSKDLIHWEEQPIALFPNGEGQCYSGSAVVVKKPIEGVTDGLKIPTPVLFFTATTPFTQHMALTPDGGTTWERFQGNPILDPIGGDDRDPFVCYHEESGHYIMVLYVSNSYRFLRSKNLVDWEQTHTAEGWYECPVFFPYQSPTTGKTRWLLYGSSKGDGIANEFSAYQIGDFDGKVFTPISKIRTAHYGVSFYGALSYHDEPKGRDIMVGWSSLSETENELFNRCATVPLKMKVKSVGGEDALFYEPIEELDQLRGKPLVEVKNTTGKKAQELLAKLDRDASLDVILTLKRKQSSPVEVTTKASRFSYDSKKGIVTDYRKGDVKIRHAADRETIDARFLIDRLIVEGFWNEGEVAYAHPSSIKDTGPTLEISDHAEIESLTVYPMRSIWETTASQK
ncbi:MAG: glycoside hydrolase family 32 protein [Verrucomicrobiota bacterium]